VSLRRSQSESRMPEIGTSGLTSGDGNGAALTVSTRTHPRLYLFIGTQVGNVLRGLYLRSSRPWSSSPVSKGSVMTLRVTESDEKMLFFEGAPICSLSPAVGTAIE